MIEATITGRVVGPPEKRVRAGGAHYACAMVDADTAGQTARIHVLGYAANMHDVLALRERDRVELRGELIPRVHVRDHGPVTALFDLNVTRVVVRGGKPQRQMRQTAPRPEAAEGFTRVL